MFMKKRTKIIVLIILIVWFSMFSTDFMRTKQDRPPVFSVHSGSFDDGGSKRFTGLFYMVYLVKDLDVEQGNVDYGYHVTFWFTDLDRIKDKVVDND